MRWKEKRSHSTGRDNNKLRNAGIVSRRKWQKLFIKPDNTGKKKIVFKECSSIFFKILNALFSEFYFCLEVNFHFINQLNLEKLSIWMTSIRVDKLWQEMVSGIDIRYFLNPLILLCFWCRISSFSFFKR